MPVSPGRPVHAVGARALRSRAAAICAQEWQYGPIHHRKRRTEMSAKIAGIRGMNDLLPDDSPVWQRVEGILVDTVKAYGYREIRVPIVERTELF